jgi:DNA-directed RNA polymerase subunit F
MEEVKKKQAVSLSEVKEILGKVDPEDMDQIQRWTFDYVSKFVDTDPKDAKEMKKKLMKECELTEEEAVEIVVGDLICIGNSIYLESMRNMHMF